MDFGHITFTNTGLPLLIFAGVALTLPSLMVPRDTRSHTRVARGMIATAAVLVVFGPLVAMAFDSRPLPAGPADTYKGQVWLLLYQFQFRASLTLALVWAPLLALVWFNASQRVEQLRGQDIVRESI
ncbi:MAG: hypothetical protein ABJD13_09620 [Paracoccaceae bacterium]